MASPPDPFRHHPTLRDRITDPALSFFRRFRPADLDEQMRARGLPEDWRYSDAEIEAARTAFLARHGAQDLWVFAYGSLMWDPAIRFDDLRVGRIRGYARRFCLRDTLGARGTPERPGLMAALDAGPDCTGLVFRIAAAAIEEETGFLWRRELLVPAYRPVMAEVATALGPVQALAFAADRGAAMIAADLSRAQQLEYLATGTGFLGSSLQYLENLAAHLDALDIEDAEVAGLLVEARAAASANAATATAP